MVYNNAPKNLVIKTVVSVDDIISGSDYLFGGGDWHIFPFLTNHIHSLSNNRNIIQNRAMKHSVRTENIELPWFDGQK